ncbi:hypothetical protein NIES4103_15490 [Nostoc sp. NIES-4103]|nr:hypothetical protein NIES4103_15490 [Nostoc sp. NIES-4103]
MKLKFEYQVIQLMFNLGEQLIALCKSQKEPLRFCSFTLHLQLLSECPNTVALQVEKVAFKNQKTYILDLLT